MNVKVVADLCIGCTACVDMAESVFKMEEDKAIVIANPIPGDDEDSAKEAAETCPVDAIICE